MPIQTSSPGVHLWDIFGGEVKAAFSGRNFDRTRRESFLSELNIPAKNLVLIKQVHGNNILEVPENHQTLRDQEADGLITHYANKALGIFTADCIPVFFYDSQAKVIAMVHAGWRGVHSGILRETVQRFQERFNTRPTDLQIALGPAMRSCCYEVGEEFKNLFPDFYFHPKNSDGSLKAKGHFDMIQAATRQLTAAGVSESRVLDSGLCTVCRNDLFFSARREKTSERILSVMVLNAERM